MRENRLSGSEGGGAGNRSPYPYHCGNWIVPAKGGREVCRQYESGLL